MPSNPGNKMVITMGLIRILCEVSQNVRTFQLFRNIPWVIIFHPCDKKINTVFSGFLVSISRWGASHNRLSWWAGFTAVRPPAVVTYKWKWQMIACIIPSETGLLEGTARDVDLNLIKPRRLSIPCNSRNCRRWYHGQYRWLCSASTPGTPTPHFQISPQSQRRWAWNCRWSRPNTIFRSVIIDRCSRTEQPMVQ